MPGFGQRQLSGTVLNANSVAVLINDVVVAFAQTTNNSFGFGTEQYYGIGSAMPQEIQQLRASPSISIDALSLTAAGMQALNGGQDISKLLANNQFDLHITNGVTQKVLRTFVGCVATDYAESISANRPVTSTISFLAIDVLGPDGTSLLQTQSAFTVPNALAGVTSTLGLATG